MSQIGSVPMSLHGGQSNVYQGDELEEMRKNELISEVSGLLKIKNDLVTEVSRLIKTQEELRTEEENYRRETKEIRAQDIAKYEEWKTRVVEKHKLRERELDSRDSKLGEAISELLDIYEYLESVQDDLVWETSYNVARDEELSKREHHIIIKEKTVDFNAEQASELVKQAQMTLDYAKEQAELVKKEKDSWVSEYTRKKAKQEEELEKVEKLKEVLTNRIETFKEKEKQLTTDREAFEFRKAQLDKAMQRLNIGV